MAGQTINDRLLAARHSLAGQGLAKSVCKATTEELIGPKKKHLDYLVHCTNEPNVSIPQLANLLIERSQNANWVVVFKALITVHHMLCYGNERFTQYLASSNSTFQLSNFLDKGGVQGYDMSPFIRRYAKYLNEKALSYRTVAFDFCKVKRGKEDGTLRTMNAEKLLKTLPVLQAQVDALLEFDCTANDLTNGVINMAFMLLFRDLIRLFACYNDGIINLLEKYFDMNKKQCRDALDLYKKFLIRMDRVGEFLKVAENVGIDKGDIPDLTKAPSSLLDALEQHLASLEGKKGSAANTPTQSASAFGTVAASTRLDSSAAIAAANGIDENLRQQALAEEEAAMKQYNAKVQSPTNSSTNPFLSSGSAQQPIVDFFGGTADMTAQPTKASDDLLQLGNPFSDMFSGSAPQPAVPSAVNNTWMSNGFGGTQVQPAVTTGSTVPAFVSDTAFSSVFGCGDSNLSATGNAAIPNPFMSSEGDLFAPVAAAAAAPAASPPRPPPPASGQTTPATTASPAKSAFDDLNDSIRMALGGSPSHPPPPAQQQAQPAIPQQQQPQQPLFNTFDMGGQPAGAGFMAGMGFPTANVGFGSPAKQNVPVAATAAANTNKVLTGDLDSSLASLAENLTINKGAQPPPKGVQWNSPKNSAKQGSTGWSPQPMAATTGAGYRPMVRSPPLNLPLNNYDINDFRSLYCYTLKS
ncbi:UNVERIFIED_CONTAM: hypothetical protein PYX00_003557 [Menopon gallinae]|uniref:ENTH domain-containing protein n=1 Tax=Menopon gallinae TaxID=328185 RepID=A0AAW2I1L3_9NEOP